MTFCSNQDLFVIYSALWHLLTICHRVVTLSTVSKASLRVILSLSLPQLEADSNGQSEQSAEGSEGSYSADNAADISLADAVVIRKHIEDPLGY